MCHFAIHSTKNTTSSAYFCVKNCIFLLFLIYHPKIPPPRFIQPKIPQFQNVSFLPKITINYPILELFLCKSTQFNWNIIDWAIFGKFQLDLTPSNAIKCTNDNIFGHFHGKANTCNRPTPFVRIGNSATTCENAESVRVK
jgi:hypothetical protein